METHTDPPNAENRTSFITAERRVIGSLDHVLEDVEDVLKRRPASTAAIVGGSVLVAAVAWGAAEAAVAGVAGYLVYRVLKKHRSHA
jgi:hypothetical protein